MYSINTNLGSMAALASLANTQSDLTATQARISTGLKVGSASDNPAIYAIAQTMNDQISGLAAVSANMNLAQSVLTTTQAAASAISSQLATLKNTVTTGLQSGIDTTTINNQITSILANIDAFATGATFNGVNIAGGTIVAGSGVTATQLNVTTNPNGGTAIQLAAAGTGAGTQKFDMTSAGANGLGLGGLNVTTQSKFAFANSWVPAAKDTFSVTVNGVQNTFILSDGVTALAAPANPESATQANHYVTFATTDNQGTVIGKLAQGMQEAGLSATVDSNGALNVAGGSAAAETQIVVVAGAITPTNSNSAAAAVATVNTAISNLNLRIAALGQSQQQISGLQSFTSTLSASLTTGMGALTDADMAAESAKLASLQTKQSLGIQSLSIANQQPQALMTLFR